jgi:hypothetical protein
MSSTKTTESGQDRPGETQIDRRGGKKPKTSTPSTTTWTCDSCKIENKQESEICLQCLKTKSECQALADYEEESEDDNVRIKDPPPSASSASSGAPPAASGGEGFQALASAELEEEKKEPNQQTVAVCISFPGNYHSMKNYNSSELLENLNADCGEIWTHALEVRTARASIRKQVSREGETYEHVSIHMSLVLETDEDEDKVIRVINAGLKRKGIAAQCGDRNCPENNLQEHRHGIVATFGRANFEESDEDLANRVAGKVGKKIGGPLLAGVGTERDASTTKLLIAAKSNEALETLLSQSGVLNGFIQLANVNPKVPAESYFSFSPTNPTKMNCYGCGRIVDKSHRCVITLIWRIV